MEPLFEAKATFNEKLIFYNVYRLTASSYKVELKNGEDDYQNNGAPTDFIIEKKDGNWCTNETSYSNLCLTIGTEIDVFNYGYGDLLGRMGENNS